MSVHPQDMVIVCARSKHQKSLTAQMSMRETRPVAPHALALKQEFKLAAPQDIGPPPLPADIPPPTPKDLPDIGPPQEAPPPLMSPAQIPLPVSPSSSSVSPSSETVSPLPTAVLPGFSQTLIPPPPLISPVADDIPPPPTNDGATDDGGKIPVSSFSQSGSSGSRKHSSRHKSSRSSSGSVSVKGEPEGDKKKKHHHKKSSKSTRERGESVADFSGTKGEDAEAEGDGKRARAVSSFEGKTDLEEEKDKNKSLSAMESPGDPYSESPVESATPKSTVEVLPPPAQKEDNKDGESKTPRKAKEGGEEVKDGESNGSSDEPKPSSPESS